MGTQSGGNGDKEVGLGAMGTQNGGDGVVGTGTKGQGWGQGGGIGGDGDGDGDTVEGTVLWAQGDKGSGVGRKPRWGTRGRM